MRALTWVIAPVLFAEVYAFSKSIDRPAMCMFMGSAIILISLTVILWPLKRAIKAAELSDTEFTFSAPRDADAMPIEDADGHRESVPLLDESRRVTDL